jgi:hypothetical protein
MHSKGGQIVTWKEYVEGLCGRFGGHKDPLEELKDLKQKGDLETYIRDFDILWNRAEIDERYALIFFIVGLETEIKNLVKMFEPKSLKQAYIICPVYKKTLTSTRNPINNQADTQPHLLATIRHPTSNNLVTNLINSLNQPPNTLLCQGYYPPLRHTVVLNL